MRHGLATVLVRNAVDFPPMRSPQCTSPFLSVLCGCALEFWLLPCLLLLAHFGALAILFQGVIKKRLQPLNGSGLSKNPPDRECRLRIKGEWERTVDGYVLHSSQKNPGFLELTAKNSTARRLLFGVNLVVVVLVLRWLWLGRRTNSITADTPTVSQTQRQSL